MSAAVPADGPREHDEPWRAVHWLLLAAAALPALLVLWVIARYGVNTPFWDQWGRFSVVLIALEKGTLGVSDLIAQGNESRPFFPRLAWLAVAVPSGWNVKLDMLLILATAGASSACAYQLARRTVHGSRARILFLLAVANLLVFGLVQSRNWLWGVQLVAYLPSACLLGSLVAARSDLTAAVRVAVCAALCVVATFSFSNGMLVWPLAGAALLLSRERTERPGKPAMAAFTAVAALAVGGFFVGWRRGGGLPAMTDSAADPVRLVRFVLAFLGAPLGSGVGRSGLHASTLLGGLLLLLWFAGAVYVWRHRRDGELVARTVGWLLLGAYAVGSAGAAALGRSAARPPAARYTAFSIHLATSLVFLVPIVLDDCRRNGRLGVTASVHARLTAGAATALVLLHGFTSMMAVGPLLAERVRRLQGKACLAFSPVVLEAECIAYTVAPYPELTRERADALDRAGYLAPRLVRDARVEALAGAAGGADAGAFETFEIADRSVRVAGWSRLPQRREPADAVLLCHAGPASEARVFALAWERTDGVGGWTRELPLERLPAEAGTVTAWAYDSLSRTAYPLEGAFAVPGR